MGWREAVGEGFGPHREGEPAALRRDIIDELTDHLDCAMRRELVGTPDERAAEQKVLARFGDPRRIARRLWLDAMKETIMSQRIMLGVVVLLAAACVAASVFAWLAFRQGQQLNQALLARLEELASRPAAVVSVPTDLAVARIRLVEEGDDAQPVADADVSLSGHPFKETQSETISLRTGADGGTTLGPIRPGTYGLQVSTPAGFQYRHQRVMLFGGRENEKVIVCPRGAGVAVPETDVSVSFAWPEDLAVGGVLTHCTFEAISSHVEIEGFDWYRQAHQCWVTDEGEFLKGSFSYGPSGSMSSRRAGRSGPWAVTIREAQHSSGMPLRAGQYRLQRLSVWSASSAAERDNWMRDELWHKKRGEQVYVDDTVAPTFEARAGGVNEWKIEIPQELLDKLREALAEQEAQVAPAPDSSGAGSGAPSLPRAGGGLVPGRGPDDGQENT